jgi:hypothetical protein
MQYRTKVRLDKNRDTVITVECLQSRVILKKKLKGNRLSHCSLPDVGRAVANLKKRLLEKG